MTDKKTTEHEQEIHAAVRDHYSAAISAKPAPAEHNCCCGSNAGACCGEELVIYDDPAVNELPADVTSISMGCGDPVTPGVSQTRTDRARPGLGRRDRLLPGCPEGRRYRAE